MIFLCSRSVSTLTGTAISIDGAGSHSRCALQWLLGRIGALSRHMIIETRRARGRFRCGSVFGGGVNVRWTQAGWLVQRRLSYWGDIDTWGLHYLAAVRRMQPHVEPLLMDLATVQAHLPGMVDEKEPNPAMPVHLSSAETQLYQDLLARRYGGCCLEQERLVADWVRVALYRWNAK